jgi:hypothetical protein
VCMEDIRLGRKSIYSGGLFPVPSVSAVNPTAIIPANADRTHVRLSSNTVDTIFVQAGPPQAGFIVAVLNAAHPQADVSVEQHGQIVAEAMGAYSLAGTGLLSAVETILRES